MENRKLNIILSLILIAFISLILISSINILVNHKQSVLINRINQQQLIYENAIENQARNERIIAGKEINSQELSEQKILKKMAKKQREQRMNQLSENSDTLTLEQLIEKYDLSPTDLGG